MTKTQDAVNCFFLFFSYLCNGCYITYMEKAKKILFLTQEIEPYVNETTLSSISRNLIPAVQETGREVRTFTPKWGHINERRNQLH